MKIFIHDYAGHPFQAGLSRTLANRGHEVIHGFFSGDPGPKGSLTRLSTDPSNLSFIGFDISSPYDKGNFVSRRFKDLEYGRLVGSYIRKIAPDIVMSGNTPTEAQEYIVKACRKTNSNFIYWLQDFYSIAVTRLLKKKLGAVGSVIGSYYRFLERRQLKFSTAAVIITDGFRRLAEEWSGSADKVRTIENWGAVEEIHPGNKQNRWSLDHRLSHSFVFLYSGTLGLKHNPEFLLALARERLEDTTIVLVAQGLGLEQVRKAKEREHLDNLVIMPLQPFEKLSEVLGTADVLVAVIEEEAGQFSVPSKVQSYLCAAKPVLLAAPADNLASIVLRREKAGIVVNPDDLAGFLEGARLLKDNPKLAEDLGRNGRSYAARAYNLNNIADRFEALFDEINATRSSPARPTI